MFNFEKLDVWQEAIQFADLVYELSGGFPSDERFANHQMRRAAVSISSNIAEGSSRASRPDFARFVEIASGSLFEVVSQSTISLRRKFLKQSDYDQIYSAAEKQSKMLSGLRKSLLKLNPQHSTRNSQLRKLSQSQFRAAGAGFAIFGRRG
jgi:four helix bundle protein